MSWPALMRLNSGDLKDLTHGQFRVLFFLCMRHELAGPASQYELMRLTGCDKKTVRAAVVRLTALGIVQRVRGGIEVAEGWIIRSGACG